jgi:catechol-2,3-dioxygenase
VSIGPNQNTEMKFVMTNTLIVRDIRCSVAFYRDVLGATVLREGEPTLLRLGNIWLTINGGGGPTDDKRSRRFATARSKCSKHLSEPSRNRH